MQRLRRGQDCRRRSWSVGKLRAVLLAGEGPSFCAGAASNGCAPPSDLDLNAETGCERPPRHARGDRPLPGTGRGAGPGPRARRRRRPQLPALTSRSPRERRVRLLGGEARDHPGRDLALRAREDRAERGATLLRHRQALRRHGDPLRIGLGARSTPTSTERSSACSRTLERRPTAVRHAKERGARAADPRPRA